MGFNPYYASLKSFKFILHLARKHHTKAAKMAGCTGVGRSRRCARQYAGARRARRQTFMVSAVA